MNERTPPTETKDIPVASPSHQWRAFWVCVSVAALTILDLTKVNVALPSIEASFGSGSTELGFIVSGYVLAFGLVLVPMGRLGDQRSRRALFIIGLSLFTLMSLVCALAPSIEVLLIGRLIQGVAAGIQMPQVIGLIQELFRGPDRGRAFGRFGAIIGISTALGPTIGGLAIALGGVQDGWRWIFWMNVPLGLIAISLAIFLLPKLHKRTRRPLALDPFGVLLFGLAVLSLMLPFLFTTGSPDDNPLRWWLLVAFVLFAAAFIAWERRYEASGRAPLIPLKLFRIASYRNGTLIVATYFTALPAMFLLTTLYLQGGLGLEPVYAGMVTIGFAVASAITSWIGGSLVGKYGRPLVVWGTAIVLVSLIGLVIVALFAPPEWLPWIMAAIMTIGGLGGGLVISPNQTLTLAEIPVKQGGVAGSVGQLGQRIGTAIGTAVALSLFYATIYRETGSEADLVVFHDAYAFGMLSAALFLAVTFLIGLVDLSSRRRRKKSRRSESRVDA
ncbi:MFS transporter [Microbacterium sp. C7(2022)]|uniref:MFS transporter n=1 Tax=Microbacterium sp. C7(2022) TaxID=2992759 RepID=UPI00237A65B0|nr:MFS transporter [Microbacterium sp. C7(2022)]MDE0546789.1 MFS transporter [Microbacterium sp. C7(2022)]